ncbi:MAG: hypothetical protein MI743_06860, partial [Sneathiellales bacterium]|nr:hypothetical protein [Sneathiellales bacterium]
MTTSTIDHHVFQTYRTLRWGIAILAISLPLALAIAGGIYGVNGLGNSWSSYYHHSPVTRDILVGVLWAVGVFFILYRGFDYKENMALNIGGFFAICVAMFPMNYYDADVKGVTDPCGNAEIRALYDERHQHSFPKDIPIVIDPPAGPDPILCNTSVHFHIGNYTLSIHGLSAILFFFSAAFVACFTSAKTLGKLENERMKAFLKRAYQFIGVMMFALPIAVALWIYVFGQQEKTVVFWMETAALAVFFAYWGL